MKTTIKLESPFQTEVVVEKIDFEPPTIAVVKYVKVPFEGAWMDVTTQVLMTEQLYKRLEDRVLTAYEQELKEQA
jgi:hypothetical protein